MGIFLKDFQASEATNSGFEARKIIFGALRRENREILAQLKFPKEIFRNLVQCV